MVSKSRPGQTKSLQPCLKQANKAYAFHRTGQHTEVNISKNQAVEQIQVSHKWASNSWLVKNRITFHKQANKPTPVSQNWPTMFRAVSPKKANKFRTISSEQANKFGAISPNWLTNAEPFPQNRLRNCHFSWLANKFAPGPKWATNLSILPQNGLLTTPAVFSNWTAQPLLFWQQISSLHSRSTTHSLFEAKKCLEVWSGRCYLYCISGCFDLCHHTASLSIDERR